MSGQSDKKKLHSTQKAPLNIMVYVCSNCGKIEEFVSEKFGPYFKQISNKK
jgi:hypothetical protein